MGILIEGIFWSGKKTNNSNGIPHCIVDDRGTYKTLLWHSSWFATMRVHDRVELNNNRALCFLKRTKSVTAMCIYIKNDALLLLTLASDCEFPPLFLPTLVIQKCCNFTSPT